MKKGFTLIELLAVIVILAILALIATPIILNIIDDSKRQASERSAELYLNGLANKIASMNLTEEFNPKSCVINNKVATCDEVEITVVDDDINITGTVWLDNGKIDGYTLNIDNQDITAGITSINCFDYTAINGQITINGYYDYENDISSNRACPTDVKIPDMIDNMPVTIIENNAFRTRKLTSLILPDRVTTIGSYAFKNSQLTSLTLPNSVETIGDSAFLNSHLTSLTLPNSLTTIGNFAFYKSPLTSLIIPNSVTTIGNSAFRNSQLTSVRIYKNEGSIAIGNNAFGNFNVNNICWDDTVSCN